MCMKLRQLVTSCSFEGDDMLMHINTVKAPADQLHSIKVNITDENVYIMSLHNMG
jgi:hypothetical protein